MLSRFFGLILIAYFLLAGLYASVTPVFEKPDENWHFAVAMYVLETGQLPQNIDDTPDHLSRHQAHQPPLYYLTVATVLRILNFDNLTIGYLHLSEQNSQYRSDTPILVSDNRRVFIQGHCIDECLRTRNAVFVGRSLSIIYVGVGILFAGMAVNLIFPDDTALVYLTSALIAFNPQVLHIASSVSNDSLTILLMNIGFFLLALWLKGKRNYQIIVFMALVAGLALITKLSAGSLGLVMGLLILIGASSRLKSISLFALISLSISAWWFIYNTILYTDPTALALHIRLAPQQSAPDTFWGIIVQLPTVMRSFWMEFGWGQLVLPSSYYTLFFVLVAVSLSSCLVAILRSWKKMPAYQQEFLIASLAIIALVFILLLRWMSMTQAPHGRLLFPAIFPLSLLLSLGILGFFRKRWQLKGVYGFVSMLIMSAIFLAVFFVYPAYIAPKPFTAPELEEPQIIFREDTGGEIHLLDIAMTNDNDALYVQMSWQLETRLQDDYLVFVHALNADGVIVSQRDSYSGLSNMPFSRLDAGEIFHDIYVLMPANEDIEFLRIGIYRAGDLPNTWQRLDAESSLLAIEDNAVLIPRSALRIIE
ncbi:MAG: hypothetical protein Phog2KO_48530 [Phototrophicaceae bacterium]